MLAERRESLLNLCDQDALSHDGRYDVHLFHPVHETWITLSVDDRLPSAGPSLEGGDGGRSFRYVGMTAKQELWPCLFEKAFARLFGGWAPLKGNSPALSLKAMTGCAGEQLLILSRRPKTDCWECFSPRFDALTTCKMAKIKATWPDHPGMAGEKARRGGDVYCLLEGLAAAKSLLCASVSSREERDAREGTKHNIVVDHAYSILRFRTDIAGAGIGLVQLRNPWAKDEWSGAWGNNSKEWGQYPEVRAAVAQERTGPGIFWMSLADFTRVFDTIYVCRFDEVARKRQAAKERSAVPRALVLELANERRLAAERSATESVATDKQLSEAYDDDDSVDDDIESNVNEASSPVSVTAPLQGGILNVNEASSPVSVTAPLQEGIQPSARAVAAPASQTISPVLASCLGVYRLQLGESANDRPLWRHALQPNRTLAYTGTGWVVQLDSSAGEARGLLLLRDHEYPDLSRGTWLDGSMSGLFGGGGWTPVPGLRARPALIEEFPVAKALRLSGSLSGAPVAAAAKCLGLYRLVPDRTVHGRPVWRHAERGQLWIGYSGHKWLVQTEMALGSAAGVLFLETAEWSPDLSSTGVWQAAAGGGSWRSQPKIRCTAADASECPPPAALTLDMTSSTDGRIDASLSACLGGYKLARDMGMVNGRPIWRHAKHDSDRYLAYTGSAWAVQHEASLGLQMGILLLREPLCPSPDLGSSHWELSQGAGRGWQVRAEVRLRESNSCDLIAPCTLLLSGEVTSESATKCLGMYVLAKSHVNSRPVWHHCERPMLYLAYSGNGWYVQKQASLGTDAGILCLDDASCLSPELSRGTWAVAAGGWRAEPMISCSEIPRVAQPTPHTCTAPDDQLLSA